MYTESKNYTDSFYRSQIFDFYFQGLNVGILDIETTGLYPQKSNVILGGLVTPTATGIETYQIFSESRDEEKRLLEVFLEKIAPLDVLVTYNGNHFDLPFLISRLQAKGLYSSDNIGSPSPFFGKKSFDLYAAINKYSTIRKSLPNLKQKTLETYMGIWAQRADEISGGESVELYFRYLRTKDPKIRETILLHNRDDILQLTRLMRVLDKLDLHKILFHTGFPVCGNGMTLLVEEIMLKKNQLRLLGCHQHLPMDYRHYAGSHTADLSIISGKMDIIIPLQQENDCLYVDLEAFSMDFGDFDKYPAIHSGYLLIKEGQEIHYRETNHLCQRVLTQILKELSSSRL